MCRDSWSALKVYWVAQACSIILVTWETTVTRLKSAATTAFCLLHCLHRAASLACCISTTGCLRIKSHLVLLPVLSYPSISQIFQEKNLKNALVTVVTMSPSPAPFPRVSFSSRVLVRQLFEVSVPKAAGDHHHSLGTHFLLRGCWLVVTSATDEVFVRFKCVCRTQVPACRIVVSSFLQAPQGWVALTQQSRKSAVKIECV